MQKTVRSWYNSVWVVSAASVRVCIFGGDDVAYRQTRGRHRGPRSVVIISPRARTARPSVRLSACPSLWISAFTRRCVFQYGRHQATRESETGTARARGKTVHDVTSRRQSQQQPHLGCARPLPPPSPPLPARPICFRRCRRPPETSRSTSLIFGRAVFDRARPSVRADTRRPPAGRPVPRHPDRGRSVVVVAAWATRRCLIVRTLTDTPPQRARKTHRPHVKFGIFDRSQTAAAAFLSFETPTTRPSLSSVSVRHGPVSFRQRRRHRPAYRSTIGCRYTNLAQMADERSLHWAAAVSTADRHYSFSLDFVFSAQTGYLRAAWKQPRTHATFTHTRSVTVLGTKWAS